MAEDPIAGPEDEDDSAPTTAASAKWLKLITDSEKDFFKNFDDFSENIEKKFANMERLNNGVRDREFQLFWANIQTLAPSFYSRPPVPVVQVRFKRKNAVARAAAEILEAACIVSFEREGLDRSLKLVRDDVARIARGVIWLRYDSTDGDRVRYEWIHRRDFRHDLARSWDEVGWVARRSYMTRAQMKKRFGKTSKGAYKDAAYQTRKGDDTGDSTRKRTAEVWEIWHREEDQTVWVSEGCDRCLDEGDPALDLEGFFPCPEPAYSTTEAGTLKPVADYMFYKDQIEEVNQLTGRIHSLAESLRLRGFYAAGQGEIGDAIETAIKSTNDRVVLIPIYNWALTGNAGVKDAILWLPIEDVAKTVTALVALRKEVIDDVYQITGLSDIMRGSTEASETATAQQLKSQYGSVRVRDRQDEMVRMALEVTRLSCEIIAEEFSQKSITDMTQMEPEDLKTDAMVRKEVQAIRKQMSDIERQLKEAMRDPEVQKIAKEQPEKAQEILGQAQQQMQSLAGQAMEAEKQVTIEQVMEYLRDQNIRPFTLEIETDSTISPDENAQKQRATEFVTAVGGFMGSAIPLVGEVPELAPVAAEMLMFTAKQFRADRKLLTTIEEFAEQITQKASQPKPPSPEAQAAEAEMAMMQAKAQGEQAEGQLRQQLLQVQLQEAQGKLAAQQADEQRKAAADAFDKDTKAKVADHQVTMNKAVADEKIRDVAVAAAERGQKHQIEMDIKELDKQIRALDVEKANKAIEQTTVSIEGQQIDNKNKREHPPGANGAAK